MLSNTNHITHSDRHGFSVVEVQVSFLLFAISLSGLAPLVVMQYKHLDTLDQRFDDGATYYLVPSTNEWTRKLSGMARFDDVMPTSTDSPPTVDVVNVVSLIHIDQSLENDFVTARVTVETIEELPE